MLSAIRLCSCVHLLLLLKSLIMSVSLTRTTRPQGNFCYQFSLAYFLHQEEEFTPPARPVLCTFNHFSRLGTCTVLLIIIALWDLHWWNICTVHPNFLSPQQILRVFKYSLLKTEGFKHENRDIFKTKFSTLSTCEETTSLLIAVG